MLSAKEGLHTWTGSRVLGAKRESHHKRRTDETNRKMMMWGRCGTSASADLYANVCQEKTSRVGDETRVR